MDDVSLRDWAKELGVTPEVMRRLIEQRRALVYDVAADPRSWGFDLVGRGMRRRDVTAELRASTRLAGQLAGSFLLGHGPLLELVPDPPTMPEDGEPVDAMLLRAGALEADAAAAFASHLRSTIQARLGAPLDTEAIEHSIREVAWDYDLDVRTATERVLRALRSVL